MPGRWVALLVLVVAGSGCATIQGVRVEPRPAVALTATEAQRLRTEALALEQQPPHTVAQLTRIAEMLDQAATALAGDFAAEWQAARAWSAVAEKAADRTARIAAAKSGITRARQARELQPDGVEGHYWYAINVGLLADADRSYGLSAVPEMEAALKRAGELDEQYDYAGPLRVLGILHLRTPGPPASIGSPRRGLRLLQRAHALFPRYPENQLYLAEALRDNDRRDEACDLVRQVLAAPAWPGRPAESADWKRAAKDLLPCPSPE